MAAIRPSGLRGQRKSDITLGAAGRGRFTVHWYTDVIRRYTDFDGRSDRPEFWWFSLINLIISLAIYAIGIAAFGLATGELLATLYGLAALLPTLGVEIRRLHDTNRSGWWMLIA